MDLISKFPRTLKTLTLRCTDLSQFRPILNSNERRLLHGHYYVLPLNRNRVALQFLEKGVSVIRILDGFVAKDCPTFSKLAPILPRLVQLTIVHVRVDGTLGERGHIGLPGFSHTRSIQSFDPDIV
jgi:hypothetical protein